MSYDDLASAVNERAIVTIGSRCVHCTQAAVLPHASHHIIIHRRCAGHGLASRSHQRKEKLNRMDRIPGKIEIMMGLERARTPGSDTARVRHLRRGNRAEAQA